MSDGLIGRDSELRSATRFLADVGSGPRACTIEGAAGVGKTALWQAVRSDAADRGSLILVARPVQTEAGFAFAALGDLLRPYMQRADRLASPQRRALEVALLVQDHGSGGPDRQAVSLAALGLLRLLAADMPVLVAVDDAQWLDEPSADVLRYVARRLVDEPVGFLVTLRLPATSANLFEPRGSFGGMPMQVTALAAMPQEAVRRLLKSRLGLVVPRPTLRRLFELSGGNPFFALELGQALLAGRFPADLADPLPVTLEALVRERVAAMSPRARRAVAVAALAQRPTLDLVRALDARAAAALAEVEVARIIEVQDGAIRFAHPLLASGALAMLAPSERRRIHARLAELVDEPEQSARHLALAAIGSDERTATLLDAAAAHAERRGAPASAADLYERAARLTPPNAVAAANRRMTDSAFSRFRSGDSARAHEQLTELATVMPAGPNRAMALIRLARVRSYEDDQVAAERLFRQAIDEAGSDEALVAAAREGVAAVLFRCRRDLPEAIAQATEAARVAEALGDLALAAEARGSRLLCEAATGLPQARSTLAAALALQPATEWGRAMAQPLFQAGVVWLWHDRLDEAAAAFEGLQRRAAEIGDESSLPYVLVMLAQVACVRGEIVAALRHADEGRELAEQAGQTLLCGYTLAMRAMAHALAGESASAREDAVAATRIARRTNGLPAEQFASAALGHLELSLGRPAEAARILRPHVEFVRTRGIVEPGAARFVSDHVEALIELGDRAEAKDVLDWYEGNAKRLGRHSALAIGARCRAALAASDGSPGAAVAALERALVAHGRADVPLQRARTLLALGAAQRRVKQKRLARESLGAAGDIFRRAGAVIWAERTSAELARISGRAPSAGELTPTERRVAALVAEGLSTKRVAAALVVSPKTVEGHLSRIYAKLGIQTRAQLAHLHGPRGSAE